MKLYIKEILAKKGLTQKDIAEKLGLNYQAFNNTLNGNPTIQTLEKVADAIGVPLSALFVEPKEEEFLAILVRDGNITHYTSVDDLKKVL